MAIDDDIRGRNGEGGQGPREQALDWAVRSGDPAFADWEAFTLWLEADPQNARAYDEVMAATGEAVDLIASAGPVNDDVGTAAPTLAARGLLRLPWLGAGLAASVALIAALWLWQGETRDLYAIDTSAGSIRTIALDAGTRIDIAGASRITLDRKDPRFARLDQGQALFTVRHDTAHPFEVVVGDNRIVDVGTVFDVRHDAQGISVAVAEGAVQFDPGGADVRVSPGEVLHRDKGVATYTLSKRAAAQVGEWREGRLTFDAAPLEEVAADLTRATGQAYVVAPGGDGRTVSGSILVAPLRQDPAAIGPLLGLDVRAQGNRWVIGTR